MGETLYYIELMLLSYYWHPLWKDSSIDCPIANNLGNMPAVMLSQVDMCMIVTPLTALVTGKQPLMWFSVTDNLSNRLAAVLCKVDLVVMLQAAFVTCQVLFY